jgi:hypothetical protein
VVATLSSGVNAIGFTYGSYINSSAPFTVTLSTGDSFNLFTPIAPGYDTGFVGFTSDVPLTKVTFAENGYAMDITEFVVATPVPLPPSLLLFVPGLVGLVTVRRRFKK